ncbi:hypothetical protein [uncultured Methanobrevibacter sp.]|uniref:hypothetical protein n=1 Tax=uncultured Methanobrevibacter sp. TaxID=253161 RepID=UPI0025EE3AC3|nr:hypothetical protein [uncultured Methanobrevibacter sp.]
MDLMHIISEIAIIVCVLLAINYNYKKERKFEKYTFLGIICLILAIICLIIGYYNQFYISF